jgi:hypothetical protein
MLKEHLANHYSDAIVNKEKVENEQVISSRIHEFSIETHGFGTRENKPRYGKKVVRTTKAFRVGENQNAAQ